MADEPKREQVDPATPGDTETERPARESQGPDEERNARWWETPQGGGEVH